MWAREDLAWLAGFYEGEGSCVLRRKGDRVYMAITVSSTDLDVLEHARSIAHVGAISTQASRPGCKQAWRWQVSDADQAMALAVALDPWLGSRRRARVREVIAEYVASAREVERQREHRSLYCRAGHFKDAFTPGGIRRCRKCCAERARKRRRAA